MPGVTVLAYTDGACSGNPGPGGWAWATPEGRFGAGSEAHTTNQRMEIKAAYEAVLANEGRLEVVSDSTYVVNCFRDRWWEGWLKKGWVNSQRKPVANRDLWEPFVELVRARGDVTFRWVKGHSGDPMNDLVDRLAVEAALEQHERSGDSLPVVTSMESPSPLPGHALVVFGHRPPELGGYGPNAVADSVRRKLVEIFRAKHELFADLVVVTGVRLGAEMLAAEAAVEAGVPFVAVLPYPHPEKVWPDEVQHRFRDLLDDAVDVLTLEGKEPTSKQKAAGALSRRDAWLARHANEAVLVWDGEDPMLGKLYRTLCEKLDDDVWIVEPPSSP
jgi:ribonuclease HI